MKRDNRSEEPTAAQRDAARSKAEAHFPAYEARTEPVKQEAARANAASDAKTARLRALRLAKEEADRIAAKAAGGIAEQLPKPARRLSRKHVMPA